MAKKKRKKVSRKKKSTRKVKKSSFLSKLKWLIFIGILISLGIYVFILDQHIRSEFEGKKWQLPARVYAQATEIYIGQSIKLNEIEEELKKLGYIKSNYLSHPGRYKQLSANSIQITTRDFEFWDELEPQRSLRIDIAANTIVNITDLSKQEDLAVIRFEPLLIGKIYPEHNEDRVLVDIDSVPPSLIEALLAVEDRNFYHHIGIDPKGILRAIISNIRNAAFKQGGSTLTQQLVKNFFLTHERTLSRKLNEFIMALILEYHYSKNEILNAYLNEIYLGQNGARAIHGFGTASEFYFAKPITELNDAEIALLVSIVKGASYYNPRKHQKRVIERRNLVLDMMHEQGILTEQALKTEKKRWLGVTKQQPDWSGSEYSAFLDLLKQQLFEFYTESQLRTEGLRIFTTLIPSYQKSAQQIISKQLSKLESQHGIEKNTLQSGLMLTTTDTAEVLAVVGARNSKQLGFNRAINAKRPIGSLIKPAIYLTALADYANYNVLSPLDDSSISMKQKNGDVWQPKNYDGKTHGIVPMHQALAKSYNLATIHLGMALGLDKVIKTIKNLGVQQNIPAYPSLLLGSLDLSVQQVTQMYQTIASDGFQVPLNSIRAIMDKDGNILKRKNIKVTRSLDNKAVFLTQSLLMNVFQQGTASSLKYRFQHAMPLAGKTGTTNGLRDSWFAGFGSNLLSVVWVGRDDNKPANLTGARGAMQVWSELMSNLPLERLNLQTPDGIVVRTVKTLDNQCNQVLRFPFIQQTMPNDSYFCQ